MTFFRSDVYANASIVAIVAGALVLLTLWTIIGNLLVFIAVYRYPHLRRSSNYLIINLAISDFLLAVTVLPMSILNDLLGYWVLGRVACNMWLSIDVFYCTASIWSLVAIAFDRYSATAYPLWYRDHCQTRGKCFLPYVVVVWVLSALICAPPLLHNSGIVSAVQEAVGGNSSFISEDPFFVLDNQTGYYQCVLFSERQYVLYSAMGSFIVPLCVLVILYTRIFILLRKRARRLRFGFDLAPFRDRADARCSVHLELVQRDVESDEAPDSPPKRRANSVTEPVTLAPPTEGRVAGARRSTIFQNLMSGWRRSQSRMSEVSSLARVDRREQTATKRMALIIFIFFLCWIPFTVMYLVRAFCDEQRCPEHHHLTVFIIWLGYANSGLNPILYTVCNEEFRKAFRRLLCSLSYMRHQRNRTKHSEHSIRWL